MPQTKTFSIYDGSGERAVVTLTAESFEIGNSSITLFGDDGDTVAELHHEDFRVREIGK